MIRRRTPSPRHRVPGVVALACTAALVLVPTACGGDDGTDEPADAGEPAAAADEPAGGGNDGGGENDGGDGAGDSAGGGTDGGLGSGSGTVTFGGEEYRFATGLETGQCRNLYDVLVVDLPLVEANGAEVPPESGRLELEVELEDVDDFEPSAVLNIPGGRWFAGDDEVAAISGIESPDMTLTASGSSISGTQTMVPLVAGINKAIEATIEVTCE